jgi:hypothetical protein
MSFVLVPLAGIEPTPRTDIAYRPVTQTRQTRREPLGHHVPLLNKHLPNSLFTFEQVNVKLAEDRGTDCSRRQRARAH